ncbi:MAG: redoxin family protein [Dysgonamonadaceae bacterium]|jgi:thiol-disulfide isomerase/thioredoxin|nr:redoxin family protein [Dysgonamonadaceae bacterium]
MLFSCSYTEKNSFSNPEIKDGITKLSGKIINYHPEDETENPIITLSVLYPVTAGVTNLETQLNYDGSFYFEEVPIECNTIGFISSEIFNWTGVGVGLVSGEETQVEIAFDENNDIKVHFMKNNLLSTSDSLLYSYEFIDRFMVPSGDGYSKCYNMNPEEFRPYAMKIIENRLKYALDGSHLSKRAADYISNEFRLFYMRGILLDYSGYISLNYQNFKAEEELDDFTPIEPDKSYYSFLRDFDLNNPQYLYNVYYPEVLEVILRNDTLNIPLIGDTPIDQWVNKVKAIMSELVGFDKGLFYDMLAANSYAQQFNNELKPLSDKQIENIKKYFKGKKGEIAKILLRKNEEIIKLAAQKAPLVVNKTPDVSKEKLMDAIISKYKGKVVVVDLWATWCGPCLDAMKKYAIVKGELKDKNIVFVYLTNGSSPQKLWEEKIEGIGGEHYYLNADEWRYLMESFDFEGIPSYVIFDAQAKLRHKFTGYPGNEEMLKMVENLLP